MDYYKIENLRNMPPFFINVVSASDIWIFLSSNGALAAGRQNSAGSIFPYETDDRLHLATSTGPKTLIRLKDGRIWEPFNVGYDNPYKIVRNLYKRVTGDAIIFEEINEDVGLSFTYRWESGEKHGIVRTAEIKNVGSENTSAVILDGVENLIPPGINPMMASLSCLVDAYKVGERPSDGRLAVFSLTANIGDTIEPIEVLRANIAWYVGKAKTYLLSSDQINAFAFGENPVSELRTAGRKAAFMVCDDFNLAPGASENWQFVMDTCKSQREVVALAKELNSTPAKVLQASIEEDVLRGREELIRIVGTADGLQRTGDEMASLRHYMSVLYNNMRGGVFLDGYRFESQLFADFLKMRDMSLAERRQDFLEKMKSAKDIMELHEMAREDGCPDLLRLSLEFLPLTFSRRHGDPSRPWNRFNIHVKDDDGNRIYHYEGNWRDIFQNWEAMGQSFPAYIAPMIVKFLNATTADGFNPYRITTEGIDWETPMPHDPWSGIGYWGDHQIVYLNKLLEWLEAYSPGALKNLGDIFTYAEIPYEILPYENLLRDAKRTIKFNHDKHKSILERAEQFGTDGKLMMSGGKVHRASLTEKLLIPILAKLSNLVPGGGIWMNTQRPEWNDANNAIVGNGLSMVTVYQLYRHINHIATLDLGDEAAVSAEVKEWFDAINNALKANLSPREYLDTAGLAFDKYRKKVYASGFSGKNRLTSGELASFSEAALAVLAETIDQNKRPDGMYHAYNILHLTDGGLRVSNLFLMLEGQSAVLGSGRLSPQEALTLVTAMENSGLMNDKLKQFFLYPVKTLNTFMERNTIPADAAARSTLIMRLLEEGHDGFVLRDADGLIRFHDAIGQSSDVEKWLTQLNADAEEAATIREIYELVFEHKQFTGRSGIMYKFEGIGCIFWHQNSKFMVSLQESFIKSGDPALKDAYYRLQQGLGFRHTPEAWGAFPLDPYSHTPYDMPAQQPGLTGQVKEEILNRMAELGVTVEDGILSFKPALLLQEEFLTECDVFRYVDTDGKMQEIKLNAGSLAFTVCQVPVVYKLSGYEGVDVLKNEEIIKMSSVSLPAELSAEIFKRTGAVRLIEVHCK